MQVDVTPPEQRPMRVQIIKVCKTHGLGRIAPNEMNQTMLVFETFDV